MVASMSCSLSLVVPGGGVLVRGVFRRRRERRRNRAGGQPGGPGSEDVFQRAKKQRRRTRLRRVWPAAREKILAVRSERSESPVALPAAPARLSKPGYTADPATGNQTGTATAWTQPPGQQPRPEPVPSGTGIRQGERPLSGGALPSARGGTGPFRAGAGLARAAGPVRVLVSAARRGRPGLLPGRRATALPHGLPVPDLPARERSCRWPGGPRPGRRRCAGSCPAAARTPR